MHICRLIKQLQQYDQANHIANHLRVMTHHKTEKMHIVV